MQVQWIQQKCSWVVLAALATGCAMEGAEAPQELGDASAGSEAELAPREETVGADSQALCVGWPEIGTWYRYSGGGPYRIDIWYGGGCSLWTTVWEKQSDGSLYWRGDFPARREVLSDGSGWIVPNAFSVGGYVEHLWIHSLSSTSVRVWIYYESLDSKPDATEDRVYYSTPPKLRVSPWFPIGP